MWIRPYLETRVVRTERVKQIVPQLSHLSAESLKELRRIVAQGDQGSYKAQEKKTALDVSKGE